MSVNSKLNNGVYHITNDHSSVEKFEELSFAALKNSNFRITMPRVQVIRALSTAKNALSAYEIHEKILADGGRIDVVSVYRVLAMLQEVGLVYKVGIANGYIPNFKGPDSVDRSIIVMEEPSSVVHQLDLPPAEFQAIANFVERSGFNPKSIRIEVTSDSSS